MTTFLDLMEFQKKCEASARRSNLVANMKANEKLGHDCKKCTGTCCTFANNTMHVSPLEALDLIVDMARKNRLNIEWREHLEQCVLENGLDRTSLGNGVRNFMRRGYTCPFFNHGEWGCGVHLDHKPYGCLAFNPIEKGIKDGGSCRSSTDQLLEHEYHWKEKETLWNKLLQEQLSLNWEKLDMPRAILSIWDKLNLMQDNVQEKVESTLSN